MTRAVARPLAVLLTTIGILAPSAASAAMHEKDAFSPLRDVQGEGRVRIHDVPLVDGGPATIDVAPFRVWHPAARIIVKLPDGTEDILPPPSTRYFSGAIEGDPGSLVFLSVGRVTDGLIITGENRKFQVRSRPRTGARPGDKPEPDYDVVVEEISLTEELLDGRSWQCDVDDQRIPSLGSKVSTREVTGSSLSTATANYSTTIAVDTDYELYVVLGSSTENLTNYIGNLLGATSTIYKRDLRTEMLVGDTFIYTGGAASDPWTVLPASGTDDALAEMGNYWHANHADIQRSSVLLLSGKAFGGGIAWIGTACGPDFYCGDTGANCSSATYAHSYAGGYAFCGSVGVASGAVPDPNAPVPSSNYWSLLEVAHELGHNFDGPHTHCVTLTEQEKIDYGVTRGYVDVCATGECYVGDTSVPVEKGTIMSYCHMLGGGTSTRYIFGTADEPSEKVPPLLTTFINGRSPTISAITAPSTITAGASGTASITNVAGLTYTWAITNGTINSGQGTNSINFTASANPVTVKVTAVNASGCGATDSKSIPFPAVNPPTNVVATATASTSVQVTWTAATGATSYRVYRKAAGGDFTLLGSADASPYVDGLAAASTAYLYKVRSFDGSSESGDSNIDLATTVIFTDPTLVTSPGTPIKAAHVTELRTGVNAVRTLAGLTAATFTDAISPGVTKTKALHVTELRTNLDAARTALVLGNITYAETLTGGVTSIKGNHLSELRNGIK